MEVFTFSKRGDQGETSLLTGERVSKASLRPEAYGTLDEASSALGLAKSLVREARVREMITAVQEDLLTIGAELSCEVGGQGRYEVEAERITRLEEWIVQLQQEVPLPRRFVLPGDSTVGAALDLARTIVRRAERRVVGLREAQLLDNPAIHSYLNRLADFLFTLARYADVRCSG